MGRRTLAAAVDGRTTLASSVYERMRNEIVSGLLAPGAKLRIDALKARYGVGASPVREALNRLSTEKLAVQLDQRGFIVAPISMSDLQELTDTRCELYALTLPRSVERGDQQWEEQIVLSLHRLNRVKWEIGDPPTLNPLARRAHRDFHRALVSAYGSPILIDFMDTLFDFSDRYRLLSQRAPASVHREPNNEHAQLADAVINRKSAEAVDLAQSHVRRTTELVIHAFQAQSRSKGGKNNLPPG
jgi:GntR family carbon starvation induced transcriptional regulator